MSEQRQEAREAAWAAWTSASPRPYAPGIASTTPDYLARHFYAGFDAGAEWQAEQDAGTIDGLKQDREFAYRSRMLFWEGNQRLRAALEACMAALEPGVWDETMEDDDECAPAIAQARAALGQETGGMTTERLAELREHLANLEAITEGVEPGVTMAMRLGTVRDAYRDLLAAFDEQAKLLWECAAFVADFDQGECEINRHYCVRHHSVVDDGEIVCQDGRQPSDLLPRLVAAGYGASA